MKIDPCREFLSSASFDVREIKRLEDKIKSLREALTRITPAYSDMPKSHSDGAREAQMAVLVDTENFYAAKIRNYALRVKAVEIFIDRVEKPQERMLLRYRYIDGLKWEDIAGRMDYSVRHVHRLHGDALQSARKLYAT